ncbi:MAG: acyl carrier protein [Candidatus Accumulibacter meliphilus]|jgi:acyl carrier protein|uniref:acyl carrier protein n=1 Tax=Candidatus Accumulibacter meliphilus TaxID=2211374 RepID=UPI002FC306E0
MLEQELSNYICQNFGLDKTDFDSSTDLVGMGVLDSFSVVELVAYVESIADVKYDALDLAFSNLESIDAIKRFVERKKGR